MSTLETEGGREGRREERWEKGREREMAIRRAEIRIGKAIGREARR